MVRVALPCQVPGDDRSGELIRRFHRPSGLTDASEVHIVITADTASLEVKLNDQPVHASGSRSSGSCTEFEFVVTPLLKSFNSLSIHNAENRPLTVQSAVLEIHEQS